MLKGLFEEYHSSAVALGQQHPEVITLPLVSYWLMTSGCLVISGHCRPSAADEEWYSPKRPSSTVVVQQGDLYTEVLKNHF